jgi:hypothetical protein
MKRSLLLGSVSLAFVFAAACGTEGTLPDGASGAATGGKGGKGGKGGSSVGGSGTAGDGAGEGGSSSGGTSSGGSSGKAGKGGSSGASSLVCPTGKGDCNVDAADGCESDLTSSPTHCGDCGTSCGVAGPGQEVSCVEGSCVSSCAAFTGDCDGDQSNGCETDTSTDLSHCGACTSAPCVDGPNGKATCDGGTCALACDAGFGDCDGDASNGCEVTLSNDPLHCGSCATSCDGAACKDSACECAASSTIAEVLPLDIHLMLDKSSSMDTPVVGDTGKTKWDLATEAVNAFIGGVTAADKMGMGFALFPGKNSCVVDQYNKPVVAIADLPGNAAALTAAVDKANPDGGDTPTKYALEGAIDFGKKRLISNPARKIAIVLATDGEPTDCDFSLPPKDTISEVTKVAKAGAAAGVPTYVIGVFADSASGTSKSAIDKWAVAGGTKKGFLVQADPNLAANLKAALDEIRKTAIGCEYKVPQPAAGKTLDPLKVNVIHTPSGGTDNTLGYVPDLASCKPSSWYYDNPTTPAKILLCPETCDVVKPDQGGKVQISVGCATRVEQ